MRAIMSWSLFFVLGLGTLGNAIADQGTALPRDTGKESEAPAWVIAYGGHYVPIETSSFFYQDSSVGKSPTLVVHDGPPPRSAGPGLHFDTRRYFYVYTDFRASPNHFAPSGWMGDYRDITIDDASREDPADGETCLKFTYSAQKSQGQGWAGIYWQQPENNWGFKRGGYNLTGMQRLTFWARGQKGGEEIAEFKVGGTSGVMPDTGVAQIGPVTLTQDWKQYAIELQGLDLRKVSGGFAWSANARDNPRGMTFYLDEVRFER